MGDTEPLEIAFSWLDHDCDICRFQGQTPQEYPCNNCVNNGVNFKDHWQFRDNMHSDRHVHNLRSCASCTYRQRSENHYWCSVNREPRSMPLICTNYSMWILRGEFDEGRDIIHRDV